MTLILALLISPWLARAYTVPLIDAQWVSLAFNSIPKNSVNFADGTLKIGVAKSAGPTVYKLPEPLSLSGFKVSASLIGSKVVEAGPFDEDSVLRIGLVAVGERTLNAVKRMFAADWVKKLFSLAPSGTGLDKIYFYNVSNRPDLIGRVREHPKSDLMVEKIVKGVTEDGAFEMDVRLDKPLKVAALWISTDGDDTKSSYVLTLKKIELQPVEP